MVVCACAGLHSTAQQQHLPAKHYRLQEIVIHYGLKHQFYIAVSLVLTFDSNEIVTTNSLCTQKPVSRVFPGFFYVLERQ
jgi:hypothetical protein